MINSTMSRAPRSSSIPIDLQRIEGKSLEVAQARISRSKIIEDYAYPQLLKVREHRCRQLCIDSRNALRHFQMQA